MFLQLGAEYRGIGKNQLLFMDYWEHFQTKVNLAVTQKEPMRRLNNARNNLKHSGIMIASAEIEGFRSTVTNFLHENSQIIFGLSFSSISMAGLVTSTEVRQHLETAETALAIDELEKCLYEVAIAFQMIVEKYYTSLSHAPISQRAFGFFQELSVAGDFAQYARRTVDDINKAFHNISDTFGEAITIIAHGMNFESYLLFKSTAPFVYRYADGQFQVHMMGGPAPGKMAVESCVRFVIDAAVRLQLH
jgi:hypothetical protein